MRARGRWIDTLCLTAAALATALPAAAQQLTPERIFASREFLARGVDVAWVDDESFAVVEYNLDARGTDLWVEGIRTGKRTRLVEGATLTLADSARPIEIEQFSWSPDRSKLLIFTNTQRVWRQNTKGTYYVYDLTDRRLVPVSRRPGFQLFAKFSPDGSRVGFVRDNDLWVVELATGAETQLTRDGSDVVINGTGDWVYEEELELRDAWRWSPDGRRIAFWRFDQSRVGTMYMVDELEQYARPIPLRYPKAGTPNSRVRLGSIELATGRATWLDAGDDPDAYLARMDFTDAPGEVLIQRLNRHQNRLDLLVGDLATGRTRRLFSETDSAWVDVDDDLTWVNGGRQLLWTSERDGYNHIYLYNRDGTLARQLTRGSWDVSVINGVDARAGWVYFTAARPSPLERQLFRVRLDGRGMQRVTPEPGTHSVSLSPDATLFLDAHSRAGTPPVYRIRAGDGRVLRVLEDNAGVVSNLASSGLGAQEFFAFTTSDGERLNGWMIRPPDFDPSRRYPVLMYVYGGPGSQTVTDAWAGSRYLWHQLLAQKGYIVASVDSRGTGGRGRDFRKVVHLNLGKWEAQDQVEAARHLASLPYVDSGRIGIWGWSYGGYMTLLTLGRGGRVFRGGISVAPVTDWRLYDTLYTERFMRTPQENPDGYRESSPQHHAARLESDLLLVHGTGDDNVHFQHTVQLADRLQALGKPFELMLYPNRTHSITGGSTSLHLFTLLTNWVTEHL